MAGGKWAPAPKIKQLESHSLWTEIPKENNRTISGGGWSLSRPQISHSHSQETSLTRPAQKGSLEVQGEWCQEMLYPHAPLVGSILDKRRVTKHGRRYTKSGLLVKSKWLAKRNPDELPHVSDLICCKGTTQELSLWVILCVSPKYCTLFRHFTCFTTFHLCRNSFPKAKKPGPLSLTTD